MNTLPFILLILYALLIITAGIGVGGYILYWLSKRWKFTHATLKKSLQIALLASAASFLLLVVFYFVNDETSRGIIAAVFALAVYFGLITVFYRQSFGRSIGLAVSYMIIGGIVSTVLSVVFIVPLRLFVIQPFYVKGAAMEPTYQEGDYLLIQKIQHSFKRGDVVVFFYPPDNQEKRFLIKRIIGLPGETLEIKAGALHVNGVRIEVPPIVGPWEYDQRVELKKDEYFVVGDNIGKSFDSRIFGPIQASSIIGSVIGQTGVFQRFFK